MTPVYFPQANEMLAGDGADGGPLPAHRGETGLFTTCWQATWRQRLHFLRTGRLWAQTTSAVLGLDLKAPEAISPQPSAVSPGRKLKADG